MYCKSNTFALPHIGGGFRMSVRALKAHLAINVRDLATRIEFYRKLFGIEPAKVRTGYAKFDVTNPPLNFTLNQHASTDAGALLHMSIQVESTAEVLALREQWHERELITRDEMQTNCCYATQDKTWVKDPDGNEWEAFVVLEDNLPEKAAASPSCCAPNCCTGHSDQETIAACSCTQSGQGGRF
jgi:catechol 2,3-dioxygenase-like lactoylglutathione lyase family enzyme